MDNIHQIDSETFGRFRNRIRVVPESTENKSGRIKETLTDTGYNLVKAIPVAVLFALGAFAGSFMGFWFAHIFNLI